MLLDLAQLRQLHPRLPDDMATSMVTRAALGLQRSDHLPEVEVFLDVESLSSRGMLSWPLAERAQMNQHDSKRVTEDGAEVIALVLANRHRNWRVIRRMQQEEHANWLLEDVDTDRRQVIA